MYGRSSWVYKEKIYYFGGDQQQIFNEVFSFHLSTAELICYNPSSNSWESLTQGGDIPSPHRGHVTIIRNDTLYLFGGTGHYNHRHYQEFKDLFLLDMTQDLEACTWRPFH